MKISNSKYWNNVATVMVGTVLSQALPLLILPLLARWLLPTELGKYFEWFARAALLAVAVGLAFESAIFTVNSESNIHRIIRAVFVSGASILLLLWLLWVVLFPIFDCTEVLGLNAFGFFTIGIFAASFAIQNCLIAALVYKGDFKAQALAKFIAASLVAAFQVGSSLLGFGFIGLVTAQVSGLIIAIIIIIQFLKIDIFNQSLYELCTSAIITIVNFKKFPIFVMPGLFIGTLAAQLPVIYIGIKFGAEKVVFFSMALKVVAIPIGLIGSSILQVFKQSASLELRTVGNCRNAYSHTFRNLAVLSIIPLVLVLFFGDFIFKTIFDAEYMESARIAKLLLPCIILGFVVSPLSYTLLITHNQYRNLLWQVVLLIFIVIVFSSKLNFDMSLILYSSGYSLLYIVYAWMAWNASKIDSRL